MATLKLARVLRSAGHTIVYVSVGSEDPVIRGNRFPQEVILSDVLPDGLMPVFKGRSGRQLNRLIRQNFPDFVRLLEGAFDDLVAKHQIDLALVDRNHAFAALPFYRLGVATALVYATLPPERRPGVPPLTSHSLPPQTTLGRLRLGLEWALLSAYSWIAIRSAGLSRTYLDLARRSGFPADRMTRGAVGWEFQIPHVVTCPECFDVAPGHHPLRQYLGPCIDFERQQGDFDWTLLDPERKLAYCALGTSGGTYQGAMEFLGRAIEAFRGLDGWQVVAATGDLQPALAQAMARPSADHVVVVRDAPQLTMLQRADVMLTHGGLGSIKECLYFGVPMVVFPGASDQCGNAARVAHHAVGAVGDLRRSTAADIRALVAGVTSSATIRANVDRMQQQFVEADRDQPIRDLVDQLLSARQPHRPASRRA